MTRLKIKRPVLVKLTIVLILATICVVINNGTVLEWLKNVLILYLCFTTEYN